MMIKFQIYRLVKKRKELHFTMLGGQDVSFNIKGIISVASPLNWVWVGVNPEGSNNHIIRAEATSRTLSYDISWLASKLNFSSLKPGVYTFRVHVITSNPHK